MPHARARAAAAAGQAGLWAWAEAEAVSRRGRQAGDERAWPVFCHLIHIITGVIPFDGGGELIASVTVPSAFRLLGFSVVFLPLRRSHISVVLRQSSPPFLHFQETTSQPSFGFPRLVPLRTRSSGRAGASGTLVHL